MDVEIKVCSQYAGWEVKKEKEREIGGRRGRKKMLINWKDIGIGEENG